MDSMMTSLTCSNTFSKFYSKVGNISHASLALPVSSLYLAPINTLNLSICSSVNLACATSNEMTAYDNVGLTLRALCSARKSMGA